MVLMPSSPTIGSSQDNDDNLVPLLLDGIAGEGFCMKLCGADEKSPNFQA
jgi:hypothetical protein